MARKHHNRPDFSPPVQTPVGEPDGEPDDADILARMAEAVAEDHVVPFQPVTPPDSVPSREGELVVAAAVEQADADSEPVLDGSSPAYTVRGVDVRRVRTAQAPYFGAELSVTTVVILDGVDVATYEDAERAAVAGEAPLATALRKSWQHLLSLDATTTAAREAPTAAIDPLASPAASAAILEATLPGAPVPAGRFTD